MKNKIVMDSAGDLQSLEGVDFASVPMKIVAEDREFVDSPGTDVSEMIRYLGSYRGKTSTACPGVGEYLEAFEDAENIYCVTITSGLSGSYNAAAIAAQTYIEQHPDRKVHVFDTLSAGPEMAMLAEKLRDLITQGLSFHQIVAQGKEYLKKTRLIFCLESLQNFANNGRVPLVVAKAVGILGIRLLGRASDEGSLQPTGKARGEKRVVPELMKKLQEMGYAGGKLRISHCCNEAAAQELKQAVLKQYSQADVTCWAAKALCSFYAESGGMLVGFETE